MLEYVLVGYLLSCILVFAYLALKNILQYWGHVLIIGFGWFPIFLVLLYSHIKVIRDREVIVKLLKDLEGD